LERARAGRAFEYLSSVREAQELYSGRNHTYASDPGRLRVAAPVPKGFIVGTIAAGASRDIRNSWTLTLTRCGASEDYGAYTITFNENGFDENSSIPYVVSPNPVR